MKTIFEHTQSNVLVIPQALFAMRDVTVISHHHNSAIFYKSLKEDLTDIEFYTNTPCFIFIKSGREIITNSNHETIELTAGSSVFLPQGLNLQSDFVKATESLDAFLVFFDDDAIAEFSSKAQNSNTCNETQTSLVLRESGGEFIGFFDSIRTDIKDHAYLNIKLQELLHLISWQDKNGILHRLLSDKKRIPPKKNLDRLLKTIDVLHLSVSDLAHISGRSLSTFNRDFKETYKLTPSKWLREKKLTRAKELLSNEELSVTDVALIVGYENVSAFIKAFKLKYGTTPKQLKQDI